ncbi:Peptidase S16, Lon proteolytic domain containing protein [Candidatus Nanopelagicaceae bacterium]
MMIHRNSTLRFSRIPGLLRIFLIATTLIALIAPMNFVFITPGPATSLFPKVLQVKSKSYPVNGQLFLLTIYVSNPEGYVPGAEVLGCWAWGDCVALPRSVMYEDGTTNKKEMSAGTKEMAQSQSGALTAAKKLISKKYPGVDLSQVTDSSIKISLENTGGPSGGLVFTLGLIDLLTPEDIIDGRKIAGTGTISSDGSIGPIGGVSEKILGAKKAGATILFVSQENCSELPSEVSGLSVIAVSTIDEVVDYLTGRPSGALQGSLSSGKDLNSAGIHGCASVGA